MENRLFDEWFKTFRETISDYKYYVNFEKVYKEIDAIKFELALLNALRLSDNIKEDFKKLIQTFPKVLECIPRLLALKTKIVPVTDEGSNIIYNFKKQNQSLEQYSIFMEKSGLFDLLESHLSDSVVDYVTGVEVGLDSNGRKNRGGHLMENLVELYLQKIGLERDVNYFKEMYISQIEKKWNLELSNISNKGKTKKRFDFVVFINNRVFAIETNFYATGGSKLNETSRSYKNLANESKEIDKFDFIWITDGNGWKSARHNLEETFDAMQHIYNIQDLENGVLSEVFQYE